MIANKPRLIVTEDRRPTGLAGTTWEQRQGYRDRNGARIAERAGLGMTAAELIQIMGPLHVNHPQFEPRPRSLLPMPNLAGEQPTVSAFKATFWAEFRRAFRWSA